LLGIPAGERTFAFLDCKHRIAAGAELPAPTPVFPRHIEAEASADGNSSHSEKTKAHSVSKEEVKQFSEHCVYLRSVYSFATRIWRDHDDAERRTMDAIAPSFFEDMGMVLSEFIVNAACRITESAIDKWGNQNFTIELFVKSFLSEPETFEQLDSLRKRMMKLREKILPARNKLGAHADRAVIQSGKPLGTAKWEEWDDFWSALEDFVRLLNERRIGNPFEIDAGGVLGDAEALLKALRQSQYFETLLNDSNPVIRNACIKLGLSEG
jgi:hypothetical protein